MIKDVDGVNRERKFRPEVRSATLEFEGDYAGMEVQVRLNVPIQTFIDIRDLSLDTTRSWDLFDLFARDVLIAWNCVDIQGRDLPTDSSGMRALDVQQGAVIISGFLEAITQIPLAPPPQSRNGNTLVEESMPMETLSPSRGP